MLSRRVWKAASFLLLAGLLLVSEQPAHVSAASTFVVCAQVDSLTNCPPLTDTVQATQLQGGSSTFKIIVKALSGNPNVGLCFVNPPNSFSGSGQLQLGPTFETAPFNSTLVVTSMGSTPPGSYLITILGFTGGSSCSGTEVHQTTVMETVTAGSITVTPTPSTRSIGNGDSAQFALSVAGVGGFSQTAFLTVSVPGTCTGCSSNIAPSQNIPPFSATMRVYTSSSTGVGSYVFEVDGHIANSTGPIVYSTGVTVIVGAANFTVSASPAARNATAGSQVSFSLSVNTVGSFYMPVALSASVPSGFTESISPSSNVPPYGATLLVGVPSTALGTAYLVTVTGTGGGSTYQTSVQVNVRLWNFTVSVSPSSAPILQGGSATFTVSVQKTNNFTGIVSLSGSASVSGINVTLLPSSGSPNYTSTMRVDVGVSVLPGAYILLVQASGGGVSKVALANVNVQAGSWTIHTSPTSANVSQGGFVAFNVSVTKTAGLVGTVTLTASAPSGLSVTLLPTSGTPDFMAVLRIQASATVAPGSYVVIIQGSDIHGTTAVAAATVYVGSSSFTVTVSPDSASIYQTQSATFTVSVNPVGGFSSNVALSIPSSTSTGVQAQIGPTSGAPSFTATLVVSVSAAATPGSYVVTVHGSGGSQIAEAAVIITVQQKPPDYTVVVYTKGLEPPATSAVYLDGVETLNIVNDNTTVTLGPFDGLSTHTVAVDSNVTLTSVEYLVKGDSSVSISNAVSQTTEIRIKFEYNKFWLVSWGASGLPSGTYLSISIGGSLYSELTPFTLQTWQKDSVQLSFSAPSQLQVSGRTYGLLAWKDSSGKQATSPVTVASSLSLTAYYAPAQNFLTVYDQQGANITFNSSTQTVPAAGYVTFAAANGTYQLSTSEVILQSAGVGNHFKAWVIPKSSNNTYTTLTVSVSLAGDLQVTVSRSLQYLLALQSDHGTLQGGGWYDSGSTANFSVDSSVSAGSGSRYSCTGYGGDITGSGPSGSVAMTGPKTVRFHWQLQYQLTVNTQYGSPVGAGWYSSGATASFSVQPPVEDGVRYTFQGWSGDFSGTNPSGTMLMDGPKTITASWSRQFQTTLVFVDAKNAPLTDTLSQVTLTSPSGSEIQFSGNQSLWLDEGTWKVGSVILHGVEVSNGGSFNPMPSGKWTISLRVYDMLVNVHGMLFSGATSGVKVQLKLPDGTVISDVTDSSGQTTLGGVPAGTYDVQASGLLSSGSVRMAASNFTIVNIRMFSITEIGTLAAVGGIAVAAAVIALRLRKPRKMRSRKTARREDEDQAATETAEGGSAPELSTESVSSESTAGEDLRVEV